jgi:RNA polymerase sigma-70 factor, ECF subfamily
VCARHDAMHGTLEFGAVLELSVVTDTPIAPQNAQELDAMLVRASQQGDTEAFGQLYQRYARMVHGVLLSRVHPTDAEDLVQEVFLRALPRLRALREASRFGAWVAAIARNLATDFHRQARSQHDIDPDESPSAGATSDSQEAAEILECIRTLPEAYRETLILRLVEGMTGPEIAERTGLLPGSVRVNLHRGMAQLREKLTERKPVQVPASGPLESKRRSV